MDKIKEIVSAINKSKNIVFFGGAGVSTESNIPDFRSPSGLYNQEFNNVNPETILSIEYFNDFPKEFYEFYKNNILIENIKPNRVHFLLKELEKYNLSTIITQNIDGLHQVANSDNVIELHGNSNKFTCLSCGKTFSKEYVLNDQHVYPICDDCECGLRPNITLYNEFLDDISYNTATNVIAECDMLIVGGTSLTVQPACTLLNLFRGTSLVIINNQFTPYDPLANIVIHDNLGDTLTKILSELNESKKKGNN